MHPPGDPAAYPSMPWTMEPIPPAVAMLCAHAGFAVHPAKAFFCSAHVHIDGASYQYRRCFTVDCCISLCNMDYH